MSSNSDLDQWYVGGGSSSDDLFDMDQEESNAVFAILTVILSSTEDFFHASEHEQNYIDMTLGVTKQLSVLTACRICLRR
jgi:hypothetical protein